MYDTKCNNGIVGFFCLGYGCYYRSDCLDGYCNMYSKCDLRAKPAYIFDLDNKFSNAVDVDGPVNNNGTDTESTKNVTTTNPKALTNSTSIPTNSSAATLTQAPVREPASKEKLAKDHFKDSPFGNPD